LLLKEPLDFELTAPYPGRLIPVKFCLNNVATAKTYFSITFALTPPTWAIAPSKAYQYPYTGPYCNGLGS